MLTRQSTDSFWIEVSYDGMPGWILDQCRRKVEQLRGRRVCFSYGVNGMELRALDDQEPLVWAWKRNSPAQLVPLACVVNGASLG